MGPPPPQPCAAPARLGDSGGAPARLDAAAAAGAGKSRPEYVNSSNPFHECSDYCLRKIAEAKQRLDDDLAGSAPPEERTVHPDCINASNPYHVCSEYCFKKIADAKLGSERREQEEPPAADAAGSSRK